MTFLKNSSRSVLEKELSVVTPKLDFMRSTELARKFLAQTSFCKICLPGRPKQSLVGKGKLKESIAHADTYIAGD